MERTFLDDEKFLIEEVALKYGDKKTKADE
jgi:hypothetical protein